MKQFKNHITTHKKLFKKKKKPIVYTVLKKFKSLSTMERKLN